MNVSRPLAVIAAFCFVVLSAAAAFGVGGDYHMLLLAAGLAFFATAFVVS